MAKQKWYYRYTVTHVSRNLLRRKNWNVQVGTILLEKRYLGKEYTWKLFNIKKGAWTGSWSGSFMDKIPVESVVESA